MVTGSPLLKQDNEKHIETEKEKTKTYRGELNGVERGGCDRLIFHVSTPELVTMFLCD